MPSSLGLFLVSAAHSQRPLLDAAAAAAVWGDAEKMMKLHDHIFLLLLERLGKA